MDLKQQPLKINQYRIQTSEQLGKGVFSSVYKGFRDGNPSDPIAIKVIDNSCKNLRDKNSQLSFVQTEIKILKQLKFQPHLIQLLDELIYENTIYMIFNYADQGSLQDKMTEREDQILEEETAIKYLNDIVQSYKALYEQNIIHRDIKPENILIQNDRAVLADFGYAYITSEPADEVQLIPVQGTPIYRAPEFLVEQKKQTVTYACNKCDIWSLGIILYEMLNGCRPWIGSTIPEYLKNIKSQPLQFKNENISQDLKNLISGMLKLDQNDRISWSDLFQNPLFDE